MKKLLNLGLVGSMLFALGCSNTPKEDNVEAVQEEAVVETINPTWLMEPSIDATRLFEFRDQNDFDLVRDGYPKSIGSVQEYEQFQVVIDPYDANACGIINDEDLSIMNYDGVIVNDGLKIVPDVFNAFYSSILFYNQGNPEMHIAYPAMQEKGMVRLTKDYQLLNEQPVEFCEQQTCGTFCYLKNDEVHAPFQEEPLETGPRFPSDFVTLEMQDGGGYKNVVLMNKDFEVLKRIPITYNTGVGAAADVLNGFVTIRSYATDVKTVIVDLNNEMVISDFVYDDAKNFVEGYCPVTKDGKWAYIDEEGNEVTDFIFDDASTIYEGKAFVIVDGKAGILNIKDALDSKTHITAEMLK